MGSGERCIRFSRNEDAYLSGTAFYVLDYKGERWPTVRHAYEAEKFENAIIRESIRLAPSVEDAKEMSEKYKKDRRSDWGPALKRQTMETLMHLLIERHERLRARLLATGTVRLVCRSHSYFWGVDKEGKGLNEHGELLMRIREHERQYECDEAAE